MYTINLIYNDFFVLKMAIKSILPKLVTLLEESDAFFLYLYDSALI